jgi:predicted PurR-regulated permease PerM
MTKADTSAGDVARRTFVSALVVLGVVVFAALLWKAKLVVMLLFFAIVLASAMRSGVDALRRHGVPRAVGIALHYVVVAGVLALLLWFAVPRALDQVQHAIGAVPAAKADVAREARQSHGLKHEVLVGIQRRLERLPRMESLVDPAIQAGRKAIEAIVGIFFVLAAAAYWIYERDRLERLVLSFVPARRRRLVSDTWNLVDLKLGAFVRGQTLLVLLVGTVLSVVFWAIGEPYWLLVGPFAGIVELVPIIGPLLAGALAVLVGLTASWQVAVGAAIAVLAVRLLEDYVVVPRVLGDAVGLSPLIVLVSVAASGVVLGGMAVLLAVPLAAVCGTIVDVVVLRKDPRDADTPTLLFPAKDAEA